jgi:hypothetical protein
MRLPADGREYALVSFVGLPDGVTPELEIGETWYPLEADGDDWRLLVRGPDAPDDEGVLVAVTDSRVRARVADDPEIIIRGVGRIDITQA